MVTRRVREIQGERRGGVRKVCEGRKDPRSLVSVAWHCDTQLWSHEMTRGIIWVMDRGKGSDAASLGANRHFQKQLLELHSWLGL